MRGPVTVAVEGTTDAAVAVRLLNEVSLQRGAQYIKNGKANLDRSISGYNFAARHACWLILRDLDSESTDVALRQRLVPSPSAHMQLHIPVRAIEAWLLADAETISEFFAVPRSLVPGAPETLSDPKRALVDLSRRSRLKTVREAMVPAPGLSSKVGPGYGALVIEYVTEYWRPPVAASFSSSLCRLRNFLHSVAGHENLC